MGIIFADIVCTVAVFRISQSERHFLLTFLIQYVMNEFATVVCLWPTITKPHIPWTNVKANFSCWRVIPLLLHPLSFSTIKRRQEKCQNLQKEERTQACQKDILSVVVPMKLCMNGSLLMSPLSFCVLCSSYRVSRSWITVCWWASTTWTRPIESGNVLGATQWTVGGRREQWPQINVGHKPRKVCIVPPWSRSREKLEGKEPWNQKTSESCH